MSQRCCSFRVAVPVIRWLLVRVLHVLRDCDSDKLGGGGVYGQMSFSSYPGQLESMDDFYMLSSNMTVIETTNQIFNTSLYDFITPQSVYVSCFGWVQTCNNSV